MLCKAGFVFDQTFLPNTLLDGNNVGTFSSLSHKVFIIAEVMLVDVLLADNVRTFRGGFNVLKTVLQNVTPGKYLLKA